MMNRRTRAIQALVLGLLLLSPIAAFCATESGETVTKRGTVDEDFYVAGGTVDIDAIVIGDIVAAGGDIYIGKQVQGDVMAAGGKIRISGDVFDDIRTAGGDIEIDALVGDGLVVAGGKIRISPRTFTGGDALLAGGDVSMAGTIGKDLSIMAGNIQLSGTVHGDVLLEGGEIQIHEGTVIDGSLLYKSPGEAKIHPDATITGEISHEKVERAELHRGGYGIFFSLSLIVAAIVLYLLFPGFTMSAAGRIAATPWTSLAVGLVVLIVAPVVAILLMGIVLGVWIGLSLLALYLVAMIPGLLISCFFLGDWGARRLKRDVSSTGRRLISVSLVIILLGLIQLVPMISGLLTFALLLLGLGAGVLQLRANYVQ
jgi:hypothetical protein